MMRSEAVSTLCGLCLFALLKSASCSRAHIANRFLPAETVFLPRLSSQWIPNVMDGLSVFGIINHVREIHDVICDEMESLCTSEDNFVFTPDLEEEEGEVTLSRQEVWREMAKIGSSCGRGVAEEGRCVCPLDYFGDSCERPRNFHCEFTQVNPPKCDFDEDIAYNPRLDGDPPCISYSWRNGGNISLGYKLNCALNPLYNPPERNLSHHSFTYVLQQTVREKKFCLSEIPEDEVLFRPFNWDRPFSDLQFSQTVRITKEILLGSEPITFVVPMEEILNASPGYSRGGRFFAEVRLLGKGASNVSRATDCWPCVARVFVEIKS